MFSDLSWFQRTPLKWLLPIDVHGMYNCFYYSTYLKGNQSKQITFFYYSKNFKLIETTGLMYSVNESSFRMLLDNENNR